MDKESLTKVQVAEPKNGTFVTSAMTPEPTAISGTVLIAEDKWNARGERDKSYIA
jgi:hypothetical protein